MDLSYRLTCLVNDSVMLYKKFWGEHGLAFLIETGGRNILFDTGTSPEILSHNLEILKKSPEEIDILVLSHGHRDHTGGLAWLLERASHPRLIGAPSVFKAKYSDRDGEFYSTGMELSQDEVEASTDLLLTDEPYQLAEGVFVTGAVSRTNDFELADPHMLVPAGEGYVPDAFSDDRSMVLDTSRGLVLIAGCCHAGLANTLDYVVETFGKPVHAVLGGIHLGGASQERIKKTIVAVQERHSGIEGFYFNHCTGEEAYLAFKAIFGDHVQQCPVGFTLEY